LWASVPETISPEWGAFFSKKGQGREMPMPAPDDIEGWKAVQAANDEAKESAADEKAAAFGVTYKEYEIAGIPVVKVCRVPRWMGLASHAEWTHFTTHGLIS